MCDCAVAEFAAGIRAALTADKATCCDNDTRKPAACFLDGLREPEANFIFHRHWTGEQEWQFATGKLVRTKEMLGAMEQQTRGFTGSGIKGTAEWALHGKFRAEVRRHKAPRLSAATPWPEEGGGEQRAKLVRAMLSAGNGN